MPKINVLVAGSTGYIGVQLINLLVKHKNVNIKYLCGNNSIGKKISNFDKKLEKIKLPKIIKFKKELLKDIDIIFTALPNGQAQTISKNLLKKNKLIDLSGDFRLKNTSEYLKWYKQKHKASNNIKKSIYALPELTGEKVKNYQIIGCPGCYPTSILLPLVPLIKKRLIKNDNIIIDSKSGYSGAGRGIHKKYKNKNLYESLSAYGVSNHRHNSEIEQTIRNYYKGKLKFSFTPHLSPMFRGILSTIYVDLKKGKTINNLYNELLKFYKRKYFVKIEKMNTFISTNDVINTNYCKISVCKSKYKNKAILLSSIDNLIKGGAGQAVQNMNILNNFSIIEGLK